MFSIERQTRGHIVRLAIVVSLAMAFVPHTARAQDCGGTDPGFDPTCPSRPPATSESNDGARYVIAAGANAALGGLTAAIGEHRRGGSFWRGFLHGAAGGGFVFAGKRISAARFSGAGLLGRQVAAVGGSVINNAAAGRPPFARFVVPLGPVRVYMEPQRSRPIRVKIDAAHVIAVGYATTRPGAQLDIGSSLSAGTTVFRVGEEWGYRAGHAAGVVMVEKVPGDDRSAVAHERVHVAQYDFAFLAWSEPAERWVANRSSLLKLLYRYVDFSANAALFGALTFVIPSRLSPSEREAYLLSGTD